ncbi:DUF6544 family protein [Flavitalea antarctica]
MIIALSIIGFALIILMIGRISLHIQYRKQVTELLSKVKNGSSRTYTQKQLEGLPAPVQRYFTHVLKEGQAYITTVRFTHEGLFKTAIDKDWVAIKGEQNVTTETPGFIWKGTTSLFTARDMYIGNKGRLTVSLFSLFKVVDARGEKYDEGELIRWLGESILYPTNLLPGERLQWSDIDSSTAKLTFHHNGISLYYLVTFNGGGEISELETKRYMGEKNLETWIIKLSDYKERSNVLVPTTTEVLWRLDKGDFSYAKFLIKDVEYNKAG